MGASHHWTNDNVLERSPRLTQIPASTFRFIHSRHARETARLTPNSLRTHSTQKYVKIIRLIDSDQKISINMAPIIQQHNHLIYIQDKFQHLFRGTV